MNFAKMKKKTRRWWYEVVSPKFLSHPVLGFPVLILVTVNNNFSIKGNYQYRKNIYTEG